MVEKHLFLVITFLRAKQKKEPVLKNFLHFLYFDSRFLMQNTNILQALMQAVDIATEGITLSAANQPDNPLVYVNKGFLRMTGYQPEDVIGKNCRFLQGAATSQVVVDQIRAAVKNATPIQVEFINYRKNNQPFWNKLSITPVFDANNALQYFIGVQEDITVRKQKEQLERTREQHRLVAETTIQVQEKEKEEIGKELHDNINQMLATVSLYLNTAAIHEELRLELIGRSRSIVKDAIEEIRRLSKSLVAPKLLEVGFAQSLMGLVESVAFAAPFTISANYESLPEHLMSDNKKVLLYRIVQEQLNNILKYAKASKVTIRFSVHEETIQVCIKDDGVGFDAGKKAKGIGLRNIQTRLELVSGNLRINTAIGKGCELIVEVPSDKTEPVAVATLSVQQ